MGQRPRLTRGGKGLSGACVFILGDQADVADQLVAAVTEAGGDVIAAATTIDSGLALIRSETISAALITMSIGGVRTEAVARELLRRGIPFAVTTGIGTDNRDPALHNALSITKPFRKCHVQAVLGHLLAGRTEQ